MALLLLLRRIARLTAPIGRITARVFTPIQITSGTTERLGCLLRSAPITRSEAAAIISTSPPSTATPRRSAQERA